LLHPDYSIKTMAEENKEPVFPTLIKEDVEKAIAAMKADFMALLDEYIEPVSLIEDVDLDGLKTELGAAMDTMQDELNDSEKDFTDMEAEEILKKVDSDEILDFVRFNFPQFVSVKIKSVEQIEKLRTFLETEIFPYYRDQEDNILF
jgi:hypothetical protein